MHKGAPQRGERLVRAAAPDGDQFSHYGDSDLTGGPRSDIQPQRCSDAVELITRGAGRSVCSIQGIKT